MITKQSIENLGWQVSEIDENIYLVHDFISKDSINKIIDQCESATEDEWSTYYMEGLKNFSMLKFKRDDVDALVKEGKLEVTEKWKDKNLKLSDTDVKEILNSQIHKICDADDSLKFNGLGVIQRQYQGAELTVHVDNHTDPSLVWAVIVYLNDDYSDGELIFPDRGIEIKPKSGSMIIFPTHEGYRHGVKPPGPGPKRYVLPSFIGQKGFYDVNTF
jgi:hypothetical protein